MPNIPNIDFTIDKDAQILHINGNEIKLTLLRWNLFMYLYGNKRRYTSTEELWTTLWSDEIQRGVVKWQATRLRREIAPMGLEYRQGYGWRLRGL